MLRNFCALLVIVSVLACVAIESGSQVDAQKPATLHQRIHVRILRHLNLVEVNRQTVFTFGGHDCTYEDIPVEAVPQLIELAADGKTIVRVVFRKVR